MLNQFFCKPPCLMPSFQRLSPAITENEPLTKTRLFQPLFQIRWRMTKRTHGPSSRNGTLKKKKKKFDCVMNSSSLIKFIVCPGTVALQRQTQRETAGRQPPPPHAYLDTHWQHFMIRQRAFLECISGFHRLKKGQSRLWLD